MTDQDQGPEESFVHLTPKGPDDAADTQADLNQEMARITEQYDAMGNVTSIAQEVADYSKKSLDEGTRTVEKLFGAKSFDNVIEIQNAYLQSSDDSLGTCSGIDLALIMICGRRGLPVPHVLRMLAVCRSK